MRILLTLTILLTHYFVIGQSACSKYSGDYNKILSSLKSKNTLSGNDKLFNTELEQIAKYWEAACSCEKGVKTREEANKIYLSIPASVPVAQYMYHGKMIKKKVDHFGDLIPTQKVYTTSSCMTGSSEPIEIKSSMDCTTEAANFYRTASDKQQYGKAFFRAYCECKNGVSRERRTQLIAEMKINHEHYHEFKAPSDPLINTLYLNDCPINSSSSPNNKLDKFSIYEDPLINSEVQGFIHDLATNSNNPHLKTLSKELQGFNEIQNDVNEYRNLLNITPSEQDLQFDQVITNAAQAISIIKFFVNTLKKEAEDNEPEFTPSQNQALSVMWDMRNNIQMMYNELNIIPFFYEYNHKTLTKLEQLERDFVKYDLATVRERKLIIYYFWNKNYPSLEEILKKQNEYNNINTISLLKQVDNWQNYANYDESMYLPNSDISFSLSKKIIQLKKARCYNNLGQEQKANEIINNVTFDISIKEAIELMQSSFMDGDYLMASNYYPIIKQHFTMEVTPSSVWLIDAKVYKRNEIILLMSNGAYLALLNGNLTLATSEIRDLEIYIKDKPKIDPNSSFQYSEEDQETALSLLKGLKSIKLQNEGKSEDALIMINSALSTKVHTTYFGNEYTLWLKQLKYSVLVDNNMVEEANELYYLINTSGLARFPNFTFFFDPYDLKYKKCELLFNNGQYQRALNGLDLIETVKSKRKYTLLRARLYKAQGNQNKAIKTINNLK